MACDETLREWRHRRTKISLLDLKRAYLQLHIDRSLWKYQVVQFGGKLYYLTRLGFGLNSAPRVMTKILQKVLSLEEGIKSGTDSYIDDIMVDQSTVSV